MNLAPVLTPAPWIPVVVTIVHINVVILYRKAQVAEDPLGATVCTTQWNKSNLLYFLFCTGNKLFCDKKGLSAVVAQRLILLV